MPREQCRRTYGAFALIASTLYRDSSAFTILRSQRCTARLGSSGKNNINININDGGIFFDDFGEDNNLGRSSSSDGNMSSLLSRMSEVKGAEAAYDSKLARNWRRGNWSVRGFALDKSSSTSASSAPSSSSSSPVHVSVVAAPTSSYYKDSSLPQDKLASEDYAVAVGRTDGSIFIIQLGDQYLTNFVAVHKLVDDYDGRGNNDVAGMAARVEKEWKNSDQVADSHEKISQKQSPFEIKHQFLASEHGESIHKLVFMDSIERSDCDGIICAASGDSGDISMCQLQSSRTDSAEQQGQLSMLSGVHHNEIISLQPMVLHPNNNESDVQNVLFSACRDGTFALWNLDRNGELMFSFQCADVLAGDTGKLTCADVFNPSSWDDDFSDNNQVGNDVIFLGTSNGYVVGYRVLDLLASTNIQSSCHLPNLCYRAHRESVTAIKCGGDGTIVTSARLRATDDKGQNQRPSSFILLTGGKDGSVKQW
jgi:hypothetical protein